MRCLKGAGEGQNTMTDSFTIQLSALAALVTILCWSTWRRHRESWRRIREDWKSDQGFRKQWHPAALDVSSIAPQIQQLRHEHAEIAHHRSRHIGYRNQLIAAVRATILRQPFFQNVNDEIVGNPQGKQHSATTRPG